MNVAVLGASGGCGAELVRQAAARGHTVTAVSRRPLVRLPTDVRCVVADVLDVAALREVVRGQDAVLCALGLRLSGLAPWARAEVPDLLARVGPALVDAMTAEGVRRVVAVSAGGVGDSLPRVPWVFRAFIRTTALRVAYADLERFEATLLGAGLEVCLARPSGLTDAPATGAVKVCEELVGMSQIPRADVAAFMLDQVERPVMPWRTPLITVTGAGRLVA